MPTTPGQLAKFDQRGNVTDSIVTETNNGSIGISTGNPTAKVEIRVANEGDWALKLQSGANDFLDIRPNNIGGRFQTELNTENNRDLALLPGTGNVGIGTLNPSVRTQIAGTSDQTATLAIARSDNNKFGRFGVGTQGVAVDFDPTSFLVIQKNTLGIGGVLAGQELLRVTADGKVGIGTSTPASSLHVGGGVTIDGTLTATNATIGGQVPNASGSIVLDQDINGANVFIVGPRQLPGSGGIVQLSSVPGAPENGAVFVTDVAGSATGITAKAGMFVDENGRGVIMADVKNFCTPDPSQPNMDIVYTCIEGPEAAVYVRGSSHLIDGEAVISLPDHFASVASPERVTVQITPLSANSLGLAVVTKRLDYIEVKELHHGTGSYEFDWEVKAVRKGHENYRVTRPRFTGRACEGT